MNFNRNFNPKVWDTPRQQHPVQPFVNNNLNPQNFFPGNQGNMLNPFPRLGNFGNFPQQNNHNNIRPLLQQQDHLPPNHNFRQNNFNRNNHNQDNNYRRPGPKCSRNNNYGNQSRQWSNNRNNDYNQRDKSDRSMDSQPHGNTRNPAFDTVPPPPPPDTSEQKSIVDLLKAVQNSKKSEAPLADRMRVDFEMDEICAKNASEAPQRLLSQIRTMDSHGVKDLINNPKQPYKKKVINMQAREKLREQMRKKLKDLGTDTNDYEPEHDECIDYERLPESLIAQIGQTLDMQIESDDMDLSESMNEDLEVVKTNLGQDFLMGSEMLLMNGFSLLAETDTEQESKAFEEKFPPLPIETREKPPSPPPEPVAEPQPVPPPASTPAFSSVDKPWSPIPARLVSNRLMADDWDFDGARNPDPPELNKVPLVSAKVKHEKDDKKEQAKPETIAPPEVSNDRAPSVGLERSLNDRPLSVASDRASSSVTEKPPSITADRTPGSTSGANDQASEPAETGRRANETYGEYRRRLAAESDAKRESNDKRRDERNENRPQDRFKQEPQQNSRNDDDRNRFRNNQPGPRDKWMHNNRINNQNDSGGGRFGADRERNQDRSNNFQQRKANRDASNAFDNARNIKVEPDGHNYRFQKDNQEPDINQLNSMLNPKPLQFSGSFNKRQQFDRSRSRNRVRNGRSVSRERTPVNNSDLDEHLLAPLNDARPCLATLRKVMEMDAELAKIHEKVHGLDKVISNLQLERVGHQKSIARLQHDRKVLFDNLMKRATSSANETPTRVEKSQSKELIIQPTTPQKCQSEKKLQNVAESKARRSEDIEEEPVAKKKASPTILETTSAAEKAAKLQREREEEERKKNQAERKRLKRLRREREEAERARLDEKIRQDAIASTVTTIKMESRDRSIDRHSEKSKQSKPHKEKPVKEARKFIFARDEAIDPENREIKDVRITLEKVSLGDELIERYKANGHLSIAVSDWENWTSPVKAKKSDEPKEKAAESAEKSGSLELDVKIYGPKEQIANEEVAPESPKPAVVEDPKADEPAAAVEEPKDEELTVIDEVNDDPLAFTGDNSNPPTPGSSFTCNEDSMLVEIPNETDYSEWGGNFTAHDAPIVYLELVLKQYIVCASESGKLYKYSTGGDLLAVFSKHTEICISFMYHNGMIYTASADGFLYQIRFKSFLFVDGEGFGEPLQAVEKSKIGVYVATKAGRIFKLKGDTAKRAKDPICNLNTQVLCMRAAKEGPRNILLVSSRAHAIQVRDAITGLLLRTLSEDLANVSIYDMVIVGSTIYCGSNRHEIFSVDFVTGALKKSRPCGSGAIVIKLYKNFLVAACYDGNIYIFNLANEEDGINICGPSNMLLAMDLWDDKIIASTKDKTLKIIRALDVNQKRPDLVVDKQPAE